MIWATVSTSHGNIRGLVATHDSFTLLRLHWLATVTTLGIWSVVKAPYLHLKVVSMCI